MYTVIDSSDYENYPCWHRKDTRVISSKAAQHPFVYLLSRDENAGSLTAFLHIPSSSFGSCGTKGSPSHKEGPAASLWMRNIQLGSFSLLLGVLAVVVNDGEEVMARGFFSGYSPMVWLCISLHSLGGLAVAMVVKYADNVVSLDA